MYKNSKNCSVDLNLQANNYIASCICVCVYTHTHHYIDHNRYGQQSNYENN